jgi:hypothetical protein
MINEELDEFSDCSLARRMVLDQAHVPEVT